MSQPAIVTLTKRLEETRQLDALVRVYQPIADALLADERRADALRGMWLGHALHPILTFLPLGSWTSATLLDLLGGRDSRKAAQRLVALGVLGAGPAALTGLAEFGPIEPRDKRVAAVHAASNATAAALFVVSWKARRKGAHGRGVALGLLAHTATGLGGYLGGHLTEARKVSSRHPAYDEEPQGFPAMS
jgi:uncharacterized membrane protein